MADGRPLAPQPPPVTPLVTPPSPPVQMPEPPTHPIIPPAQPIAPPTQSIQPPPMPHLNWLHFKPEFTGIPDKDAEAHLLRTMNGWTLMLFQKVSKSSISV